MFTIYSTPDIQLQNNTTLQSKPILYSKIPAVYAIDLLRLKHVESMTNCDFIYDEIEEF